MKTERDHHRDTSEEQTFDVRGMTCASCARRVERTLAGQPGVSEAAVNFALEKVTVSATAIDFEQLSTAVENAGYELVPPQEMHGEHEGHDHGITIGAEEERAPSRGVSSSVPRSSRSRRCYLRCSVQPRCPRGWKGWAAGWKRSRPTGRAGPSSS